jgi:hypothetical protein
MHSVYDVQSPFGQADEGFKSRTGGRDLALSFDEGPIFRDVHFESARAQGRAHALHPSGIFSLIPPPKRLRPHPQGSEIGPHRLHQTIGEHFWLGRCDLQRIKATFATNPWHGRRKSFPNASTSS